MTAAWEPVLPGVLRWRDSCNVYALEGSDGVVIVDAGTGAWIDAVADLPARPVALLLTHFFRDHSAGASRAARELAIPVYAPEREIQILIDPLEHFRGRSTWVSYTNYWDHFAPIEAVPVAGPLRDGERLTLGGLEVEVIPLAGATISQVGFAFSPKGSGQRAVCSAEAIHSPGKLPRVAPLQYDYNDLRGGVEAWFSAAELRRRGFDVLLPSLGEPMLDDAEGALAAVQRSIEGLLANRPWELGCIAELPGIRRIADRVWIAEQTGSVTTFLLGPSGNALAIDYGYHSWRNVGVASPAHRGRSLVHTLDILRAEAGADRIDVVIPSHYHDDHVASIPALQRMHGTEVWAHERFADILAHPMSSGFPCTDPTPMPVSRRLDDESVVTWEGIDIRVRGASGHTRFEQLVAFEVDGVRYAHSGDQYGFRRRADVERHADVHADARVLSDWSSLAPLPNQVYKGGAFLDSFAATASILRDWRPSVVLSGHWPPFITNDGFFDLLDAHARQYEASHRAAMPLADDDVHFDVDSWGGFITPYRLHLAEGETGFFRATVRNPYGRAARLDVRMIGPNGWTGTDATAIAPARAEATVDVRISPPAGTCRRIPVAVELTADGRPFGQVAEAIVTVGGRDW